MAEAALADGQGPDEAAPLHEPRPPPRERVRSFVKRHGRSLPLFALAVVAVALGSIYLLRYLGSFESTDDAQIDGNASSIGARIAGTVVAVHVDNNERVRLGSPLVELDPVDYQVALRQAQANLEQARFQRVGEAEANVRIAQHDLRVSQHLAESGSVAPEEVKTRQSTADARAAEVSASRAAVKAQEAAVAQAQLALSYTRITAPVAGIVGQKQVNVGDRVQEGQALLAIVQVDDLWVTADYKETQLRNMHPGQRADVRVDALGQTFRGEVESMPGASGARFSLLPPENATGNYVKVVQRLPVRIRLEPGQANMDRLRPGMSVEPKVWLH